MGLSSYAKNKQEMDWTNPIYHTTPATLVTRSRPTNTEQNYPKQSGLGVVTHLQTPVVLINIGQP